MSNKNSVVDERCNGNDDYMNYCELHEVNGRLQEFLRQFLNGLYKLFFFW